jgi:hypothetical protein
MNKISIQLIEKGIIKAVDRAFGSNRFGHPHYKIFPGDKTILVALN